MAVEDRGHESTSVLNPEGRVGDKTGHCENTVGVQRPFQGGNI